MSDVAVYILGFVAQGLFSARTIIQWLSTERARRIESPTAYWLFSVAGAWLLFLYGWLRDDFSIILGQVISYYIYLWNLGVKGLWHRLPAVLKGVLLFTPSLAVVMILRDVAGFATEFFCNDSVPMWLLIFGSVGQVIFTLRFVYQWLYSRRRGDSSLPLGFWIMSILGSVVIVIYGAIRLDPILILGQSIGLVAYARNIIIGLRTLNPLRNAE
jgi:lipid-A-disaccharide synthase-like uncharacterized protein